MSNLWQRLRRLFRTGPQVVVDGRGYRVDGIWCSSQKEVRQRLEELRLTEGEIISILRELNSEKYGHPHR